MEEKNAAITSLTWDQLNGVELTNKTKKVLNQLGFTHMTPVQAHTVPLFLSHKDVAVQACTGSGKTLAFIIPAIEIVKRVIKREGNFKYNECVALIVVPIRELAQQVYDILLPFAESAHLSTLLLIGGETASKETLKHSNTRGLVVVGTPGRLKTSLYSNPPLFETRKLEVLVLDEADRLLEMGFEQQLNQIFQKLPKQRRTGLFSATQTDEVKELVRAGLRNPVQVNVKVMEKIENAEDSDFTLKEKSIPNTLKNYYSICDLEDKLSQLASFILKHKNEKIIVYFLTCASVNYIWKAISKLSMFKDFPIYSLHGKVPHKNRTLMYKQYLENENGCLFTTDVASRGLDIPDVNWIVQYDPPTNPKAFVHRIGRTARLGKEGQALVYLTPEEDTYIEFLNGRKIPIEEYPLDTEAPDILPLIKEKLAKQRELYDKSLLAFVSHIRAYKEHQCSYIFRFNRLDLGKLANSLALLNLPKMPEIPHPEKITSFTRSEVDLDLIPYNDKVREKHRKNQLKKKKVLQKKRAEEIAQYRKVKLIGKNDAWSQKKKVKLSKHGVHVIEKTKPRKDKKNDSDEDEDDDDDDGEDDWAELVKEKKLKNKLRKGKISKKEYQESLVDLEENEGDD